MDVRIAELLAANDLAALFETLGWARCDVPIVANAWPAWGWHGEPVRATVVAREPGCRVVVVDGPFRRDLIAAVARRAPADHVLWCFSSGDDVCIAFASKQRVRRMSIDRSVPDVMGISRLMMLDRRDFARPELDPAVATAAHLDEVLDAEGLTREFFKGFSACLELMASAVERGPSDPAVRWSAALIIMLRLVFIYFLQREGMLDGDRRYIARRLRGARSRGRDDFFEQVMHPLFFGVLNTPVERRTETARALGEVPFLNGGLFEPTPTERAFPRMRWDVDVLAEVVELFERFHFTAVEPTGPDEARVVDPAMLGKVFEGLMYGSERKSSGSFYTPRDVVREIVDTTIDAFLADREHDGVDVGQALQQVRILDPAVGTGAFLLEAFASLKRRREAHGLATNYAALRGLVHDHLFGVDQNRTAVRLCELRLWLAMLSAMRDEDELEPLPNLSHRVVAGDSLLDGVDVVRRRAGALHPDALPRVAKLEQQLEAVHSDFLQAHGERKTHCRRTIARVERELQVELLAGRRRLLERRLEPLRAVGDSADLFGEPMATEAQRSAVGELEAEIEALEAREQAVRLGHGGSLGFSYETRFGTAAREGFDIIVTNPPWVRAQLVGREHRQVLAACYYSAANTLWAGASDLGIRTPYGTQPDLAAMFVERSLELLRPGGRLGALIPAKLFRALHASPMRRLLEAHHVERIDDMSDADRQLFDATVYPGILHVRKSAPQDAPVEVRVWRGPTCSRFRRSRRALGLSGHAGEPWALVPNDVHEVITRVTTAFPALGNDRSLTPRRGVFTGANDVFIRPRGDFEREFGPSVRPFVRPFLTGSGLGEEPTHEVLWCYDGVAPLPEVPRDLARYFERHRPVLEGRSDYRGGPIWKLFRVRDDTCAPKVAWRDMSVVLEPVSVADGPVASNTVYYVSFDDPRAAAGFARWMRSPVIRACAHSIAEHARGGWRRHFAWVVRMLPIPSLSCDWANFDPCVFGVSADELAHLEHWLDGGREAA